MKKNKGKLIFVAALLIAVTTFMGCMSMVPISEHSSFPADGSKYKILGHVQVETSKTRSGYSRLFEEAQKIYPGADDVVNITVDAKQTKLFFGLFKSNTYVMSGIAIDYN